MFSHTSQLFGRRYDFPKGFVDLLRPLAVLDCYGEAMEKIQEGNPEGIFILRETVRGIIELSKEREYESITYRTGGSGEVHWQKLAEILYQKQAGRAPMQKMASLLESVIIIFRLKEGSWRKKSSGVSSRERVPGSGFEDSQTEMNLTKGREVV
ncbi:MAG: hypothetical protein FJZ04_02035 [Candidatus Moranbacteria bacterium]|nr:hypothetical protein [Candidatus Moranbacteria bacterium]